MDKKIKAFGEVMMKLEVPAYQLLEQTQELKVSYSGTGVNFLSGLSKLGHHTSFLSCLPENTLGDAALAHIRSLGIGTNEIIRKGAYLGSYILEKGFSARQTKVTYSNRSESSFCTSALEDYPIADIMQDAEMIHFCGIMLAVSERTRELALTLAKKAYEAGITVVFDCNYRPALWQTANVDPKAFYEEMLTYTDICFMTEKDALHILGWETTETTITAQIEDMLPQIAETYHIEAIAGTIRDEKDGAQLLQGFIHQNNFFAYSKHYVYNTLERIGAGDGFASGIIHGIIHDLPAADAISFATAAGVLAHTINSDSPRSSAEDIWRTAKGDKMSIER